MSVSVTEKDALQEGAAALRYRAERLAQHSDRARHEPEASALIATWRAAAVILEVMAAQQ